MKLLSMNLQNFKGIKDFTLVTNGENVTVYGENGAGKTTLMDAFLWLLFSKCSDGRTKFELKTLTNAGKAIEKIEHTVKATFEHNGNEFTLKRVLYEKWSKPRGQADHVYGGDETGFFINDAPKKKGEYEDFVSKIVSEDIFRMVTNPMFFNSLEWKKRRETMLALVPEINASDVIKSVPNLAPVLALLANGTTDDALARLKAQRKKLNDEIDSIPVRIDEINRGLEAPAETVNIEKLRETRAKLEAERKSVSDSIANATKTATENKSKVYEQINNVTMQLNKNREIERDSSKDLDTAKSAIKTADSKMVTVQQEIQLIETKISHSMNDLTGKKAERATAASDWKAKTAETAPEFSGGTCPCCGQDLPPDQMEQKRAEALSKFESDKAEALNAIEVRGNRASTEMQTLTKYIETLEQQLTEKRTELEKFAAEKAEAEKVASNFIAPDFSKQNEMLEKQLESLRKQADAPVDSVDTSAFDSRIVEIDAEIATIDRTIANQDVYQKAQIRVNELKQQESKLSADLVKTDGDIILVEEFITAKVALVESQLNSLFKTVSFKLFDRQINGGINETFVTLINGVPFPDANTASQINSGLEIIEHLCKHYDFRAPVFVDHAESVTKLYPIQSQTIGLMVSDKHKTLTVEVTQ